MNILRILSFAMLLIFAACDTTKKDDASAETTSNETTVAPPEGTAAWNKAWNSGNLEALQQMTADDAVMLSNGKMLDGDQINFWYEANAGALKELQTSPSKYSAGETITYEGGSYSHKVDGMGDQRFDGVYTIIWERIGQDWKIRLINISNQIPNPAPAAAEEKK